MRSLQHTYNNFFGRYYFRLDGNEAGAGADLELSTQRAPPGRMPLRRLVLDGYHFLLDSLSNGPQWLSDPAQYFYQIQRSAGHLMACHAR